MQSEALGDIATLFSGGTPKTSEKEYWDGNYSWLSSGETDKRFITDTEKKITQAGIDKSSTKLAKKGDIVIASAGQGKTRGQTAYCNIDTYINQSVVAIRADSSKIDAQWLFYNLSDRYNEMRRLSDSHSIRGSLTTKLLKTLQVNYPPLQAQKKISHILSTLDKKIELNRKMNKTLEEIAQVLFKSWFIDFDPVHAKATCKSDAELEKAAIELGISKEILELFPSEFEESEMEMIPKGWEVQRFGDVVEKYIDNRGKTPPTVENGIPLLEVRNMPDDMLTSYPNVKKFVTEEIYDSWFRSHLEGSDILISTVGTIGKTCIMPSNTRIAIAQNVLGVRFKFNILDNQFMFYQMKSKRFLHAIDARLVVTVQASIKRKDLNTIDIIVPSQSIQELFVKQIQPMIEKQQSNENSSLEQIRDSLLPKLLSGALSL